MERDERGQIYFTPQFQFQSTRPVWSATPLLQVVRTLPGVSIHAPRMECDTTAAGCSDVTWRFNPRAPYGARHFIRCINKQTYPVSIHAPRMERDSQHYKSHQIIYTVSIHAPRMERDKVLACNAPPPKLFQSTRPVWSATSVLIFCDPYQFRFQSTRPVWSATANFLVL